MVSANTGYAIIFARSARKDLEKLDPAVALRILAKIEALASTPRPSGCKKLRGHNALWRIRIGEYRVIYAIDDVQQTIDVAIVRHRSQIYKDLD